MGFKSKKIPEGGYTFELESPGDVRNSFLRCAIDALKAQEFGIAVDLKKDPRSIKEILTELSKLNGAVKQKGKKLIVNGLSSEIYNEVCLPLSRAGVQFPGVDQQATPAAATPAAATPAAATPAAATPAAATPAAATPAAATPAAATPAAATPAAATPAAATPAAATPAAATPAAATPAAATPAAATPAAATPAAATPAAATPAAATPAAATPAAATPAAATPAAATPAAATPAAATPAAATPAAATPAAATPAAATPAPTGPLDERLKRYKEALDHAYKTRTRLKTEKEMYTDRLHGLKAFSSDGKKKKTGAERIGNIETFISNIDKQKKDLTARLEALTKQKSTEEEAHKKALADFIAKAKEKMKPIVKKVSDLEKQRDKLVADLNKKQAAAKAK